MPTDDQPIGTYSGASREEILLIFGALALAITLAFAVRALRRWLVRRREMHRFFRLVDDRNLDEREEEAVRDLAAEARLRRPTEVLTSLPTFDALAENSLRKTMEGDDRDAVRQRMDRLYSARMKLFPEARSWNRGAGGTKEPEPKSPARPEPGDSQPAVNV